MSQKVVNRTTGLVDYKELETNILSSIREGRPLTGRDGALTPFIKKLLEVSLGAPRSAWRTVGENPTQTKSSQQFGTDHYVA